MQQRVVKARAAADFLGLGLPRFYALARQNLIPGTVRVGEKSLRFDMNALEQFVEHGGIAKKGKGTHAARLSR